MKEPTMFRSWKLGTAFGIGIYVHWTFLLLPLYLVLTGVGTGHGPALLYVLALVGAVFGCVVLHELGHALTARRFGIATRDITLYPIGGVARLERMSERPWEEFWIALAGPAVNVGIAALLAFASPLFETGPPLVEGFADHLLAANLVMVIFNLLPAFPMDGGRVLRAVLSHPLGRLRATEVAAGLGVVMAVAMFLWGATAGQPFLMFGAVFVFLAGRQELAAVRYREAMRTGLPQSVVPPDYAAVVGPPAAADSGFSGFTWDARARLWVLWRNGRPVQWMSAE
jgi:Zn-dependent protease